MNKESAVLIFQNSGKRVTFNPKTLTEGLRECEIYMEAHLQYYNKYPTVRDTAQALGISTTAAFYRIKKVRATWKPKPKKQ
jgi:transcriptional regulator of aromatic amino acid metabolism